MGACVEQKKDTGEWRSGSKTNGYHVRQMLAPLTPRVSIGKESCCLIIA